MEFFLGDCWMALVVVFESMAWKLATAAVATAR